MTPKPLRIHPAALVELREAEGRRALRGGSFRDPVEADLVLAAELSGTLGNVQRDRRGRRRRRYGKEKPFCGPPSFLLARGAFLNVTFT